VASCHRKIFAERLPEVAPAHARRSDRLTEALRSIALGCGGEGGSRLAERLGMAVSPDTLLRLIRRRPSPSAPTPRVLGVDDWAFRRGQRYGTILCDLESHRVVDLLPERSAESFRAWLGNHPGIEIISRDRGDYYIKGATAVAPNATQVADRWHLLSNLRKALIRIADRHPQQLLAAADSLHTQPVAVAELPAEGSAAPEASEDTVDTEIIVPLPGDRRRQCYEKVMDLHRQGLSQREIARRVELDRGTVGKYVHAESLPERAKRTYRHKADRFGDYLWRRWQEGCHNAAALTTELRQQGFRGSYYSVKRRVARWRHLGPSRASSAATPDHARLRPASHRIAWLMLRPDTELLDEERALVCKRRLKTVALDGACVPVEKRGALDLTRGGVSKACDGTTVTSLPPPRGSRECTQTWNCGAKCVAGC